MIEIHRASQAVINGKPIPTEYGPVCYIDGRIVQPHECSECVRKDAECDDT